MNRFAYVVCEEGHIDFVIPEIELRGSEPGENLNDVLALLATRYGVVEYQLV